MVLNGEDEIDWFTDHPYRFEGLWKQQKLLRRWDQYFATSEPKAQAETEIGEDRHLLIFEMLKRRSLRISTWIGRSPPFSCFSCCTG